MANNVLLGALPIVEAQTDYTGGGIVSSPIDMVTLPTDSPAGSGFNVLPGGPAGGGGDISFKPFDYVPPAPPAPEDETPKPEGDGPKPMSKKNMLLIGIGALVLGYLVLRKK